MGRAENAAVRRTQHVLARVRRLCCCALIWLTALRSDAQDIRPLPPTESVPPPALHLQDLENLALMYNPTLAQAAAAIDMQRGVWQQAGLYPNPQVGYLRSDASRSDQAQTNGVFLNQEIVTGHKLQLARAVEGREIERLRWEREAQRLRVLNDLRVRYYEVLGAQEKLTVAEDLLKLAQEGVQAVERQQENRLVSRPDVLQAQIQLSSLRIVLEDARTQHAAAWRQLVNVMGMPEFPPSELAGRLDEGLPELEFEKCLQQLFAASPQLRVAEVEVQHARREIQRELAQPIPNVTLQTVAEYDRTNRYTSVSTLLAVPVPVYNRNQGNIKRAYADLREAEAEVVRVQLVLRDQLAESFRRYASLLYRVAEYRDKILPKSQENLELVQTGVREGQFNLFQLLTARQTYAHAWLGYVESVAELQKVGIEINGLQLTGGLNPATLGTAIQNGGNVNRQGLLNQVQEGGSKPSLPGTLQSLGP